MGLFTALLGDAPYVILRVLFGTVDVGGVLTTTIVYFINDLIWRQAIATFFPDGKLGSVRAFRLPVLGRLLFVFLLIGIGFPVLLVSLSLQRAQALVTAPNPEAILSNLLSLELFILGATGLAGVALAVLVTRGITAPLRRLQAAMARVEQDDYSVQAPVRVPVTTNDELGYLCERFNDMAEGLERRDLELQTVYQISQDITASLELDQTLQTVLERVRQMIAYDGAEICLYDEMENVLRVRAWAGSDRILVDTQGHVYRLGKGYTGWIGEHCQSLLVPDVDAHQAQRPVTRQIADGVLLRSYLGVPLVVGQSMVGTLNLASTRKGAFDDHARQLLETIAPQAAIAIENAAQVLERERRLKEQIERLRIEIDEAKRARQVEAITETEYFQELRKKARHMRGRAGASSPERKED